LQLLSVVDISFFLDSTLLASQTPKHSKRRVEDATRDDTVREQRVASVTVDPSSGSMWATQGQSLPAASLSSLVTIVVAPPKQTLPSAGEATLASDLAAVPARRPLCRCSTSKPTEGYPRGGRLYVGCRQD
jgi:hypothetical protein